MTAPALLTELYTGSQCAAFDAMATSQWGFSADQLMARAGEFAWQALQQRWPKAGRICVCAGVGNNAGDGYVLARLAREQGYPVTVLQQEGRRLQGAAGRAQAQAEQSGVSVLNVAADESQNHAVQQSLDSADVLVDALLGIGLRSAPRPLTAQLIGSINQAGRKSTTGVLALDVPSGLNAETGASFADVVRACLTTTFVADKLCLRTGVGRVCAGTVLLSHLGIPLRHLRTVAGVPHVQVAQTRLPRLNAGTYKHGRGHVVVVGGDTGMSGAVLLTAEAALRSGAGLVSVITRGASSAGLLARVPELMVMDAARWPEVQALLQRATVVICGPGLGRSAWGRNLLGAVLSPAVTASRVLDADALNLLTTSGFDCAQAAGAIITPHSGEAARLLDCGSDAVESDRVAAVQKLAALVAGVAVLKGPGTLVADAEQMSVCAHGNAGMATAGMGDVLAGVIGGLLGQAVAAQASGSQTCATMLVETVSLLETVVAAVAVHSAAADSAAAQVGMRALLATDLLPQLGAVMAQCGSGND